LTLVFSQHLQEKKKAVIRFSGRKNNAIAKSDNRQSVKKITEKHIILCSDESA